MVRAPKVRTSHHRNKEEAERLQALVNKRLASEDQGEDHLGERPYSEQADGATTFDPEDQFEEDRKKEGL